MKRELSYREEMVQQLHIVRGENTKHRGEARETGAHIERLSIPMGVHLEARVPFDWYAQNV